MVAPKSPLHNFHLFLVFAGFSALAGCSGDDRLVICPRVGVLYDAARLTDFAPGGPKTVENVAYDAEINDPIIECEYDEDVVTADIKFSLDILRGPKGISGQREFKYFVAVTELNQSVLEKNVYKFRVDFSDDERRSIEEREAKNIKINFSRLGRGDLYEILVGWDLTPEELAYNRGTSPFDRPNLRRGKAP